MQTTELRDDGTLVITGHDGDAPVTITLTRDETAVLRAQLATPELRTARGALAMIARGAPGAQMIARRALGWHKMKGIPS